MSVRKAYVVPAFNEEENLPDLIADLESRPILWQDGGVLIVVDDGSADRTAEVAESHSGPLPVEVVRYVISLEGDTTSDLDAIERMLINAWNGADVVIASVHAGGDFVGVTPARRFLSRSASLAIRASSGVDARSVSSFFRVYRSAILASGYERYGPGFICENGFACKAEILFKLARIGARIDEVPTTIDWSRRRGESKMRITPTIAAYVRLMAKQMATRHKEAA
jgi:dolichol-phosphate mannosyltransferase